jgi:hydroxypyruvate isomerase
MPKFSANLSMLFTDLPFLERFAAAKAAGFTAVEYLFPYEHAPAKLSGLLKDNGLTQVLFNLPAGDWAAGDRGIAVDPSWTEEFRAGVAKAITYAKALNVPRLNCLAGKIPQGVSEEDMRSTFVSNLRFAADALAREGLTLLIEFINRKDIPGFYLHRSDQALAIMEEVGRFNLFMQYDVYHAQREEGELAATMRAHMARIGHIQIADNPGRHQPGTGEINFPFLFEEMDRLGYAGHVGLEYVPEPDTLASLAWMKKYALTHH